MNVATRIITKLGGHQATADLLGVHITNVYRWTYSVERTGGTGGLVPPKQVRELLKLRPKDFRHSDFFPKAGDDEGLEQRRKRRAAPKQGRAAVAA